MSRTIESPSNEDAQSSPFESPNSVVKSAARVFEVLELFRRVRGPLTASEIGQALDYPKSSTNALLKSLVTLGYLALDRSTLRYFPSLGLTQLGDWIPSLILSSGDVFEAISEMHAVTRETVTLSVQSDLTCRFLRVLPGTYAISLHLAEGTVVPLFGTAVGAATMSQFSDDAIRALVVRANQRPARRFPRVDEATEMSRVRETRERGYAIVYDAVIPDTGALAVALESRVDGFPMAIGIGGLRDRIRRHETTIYRAIRSSLAHQFGRRSRSGRKKNR